MPGRPGLTADGWVGVWCIIRANQKRKGQSMPKGRTHKGTAKRMRRTRTGKIVRSRAGTSHLMSGKTGKRRRRLRAKDTVKTAQAKTYSRLLGR